MAINIDRKLAAFPHAQGTVACKAALIIGSYTLFTEPA